MIRCNRFNALFFVCLCLHFSGTVYSKKFVADQSPPTNNVIGKCNINGTNKEYLAREVHSGIMARLMSESKKSLRRSQPNENRGKNIDSRRETVRGAGTKRTFDMSPTKPRSLFQKNPKYKLKNQPRNSDYLLEVVGPEHLQKNGVVSVDSCSKGENGERRCLGPRDRMKRQTSDIKDDLGSPKEKGDEKGCGNSWFRSKRYSNEIMEFIGKLNITANMCGWSWPVYWPFFRFMG